MLGKVGKTVPNVKKPLFIKVLANSGAPLLDAPFLWVFFGRIIISG